MGEVTGVGWTDHTHNEWIGCDEVGPGCVPCYARELDRRYQWGVAPADRVKGNAPHWGLGAPRHRTSESNRRNPLKWNAAAAAAGIPARVFCNSLSDVFDNEVDQAWREALFATWRATPWLRWQVLTKRVPNVRKMLPADWGPTGYPNVGLVATVVNQEEFDRDAPRLLRLPARWYGFSMEPQIGPIDVRGMFGATAPGMSIWCITGGESHQPAVKNPDGTPREPYGWDPGWAIDLIRASGVLPNLRVYVKQTGARPIGLPAPRDGMGKDPAAWPPGIVVQQFPPEAM